MGYVRECICGYRISIRQYEDARYNYPCPGCFGTLRDYKLKKIK